MFGCQKHELPQRLCLFANGTPPLDHVGDAGLRAVPERLLRRACGRIEPLRRTVRLHRPQGRAVVRPEAEGSGTAPDGVAFGSAPQLAVG